MNRRNRFVAAALEHLGQVVVWGQLDCSDLVARAELAVGLPDRRSTHTAQRYCNENPQAVNEPEPGDLGFFGWNVDGHVIHVVIALAGGHVLSADGATSSITDKAIAKANPSARVRVHQDISWYRAAPFLGWRRHHELDKENA